MYTGLNMTRDNIITLPNLHLRQKSSRISTIDGHTLQLIADMKSATLDWEQSRPHEIGAALAAVQINHLKKIVIIRGDFEDKKTKEFITLINPEIIKTYGEISYDHEGCLSVPDVYGLVPRHNKIRLRATSELGKQFRMRAEGFLARVLQHEIDHTNGTLFIDYIRESRDAFFKLNAEGNLIKLDYETDIKKSRILW